MNLIQIILGALVSALLLPFYRLYVSRWKYGVEAKRRGCGSPPDARGLGPLGTFGIFQILRAAYWHSAPEYLISWMNSMGEDIHTCRYNILGDDFIFTRDPENFKAMFVTQVDEYDHGDARMATVEPLMGTGGPNNRGEPWKRSRLLLRPQFSRDIISDLEVFEHHLEDIWRLLDDNVLEKGWTPVIDLMHIFTNLTLGTSTEMLLGHRVNCQQPQLADAAGSNAKAVDLHQHFYNGSARIYIKLLFGKKHWIVPDSRLSYHCTKIREYLREFIVENLKRGDGKSDHELGSKHKFVFLDELTKSTRDPVELENEILGVLSAGIGTTATLLTWVLYFLARDPKVFKKLRIAVLSQFGSTPDNITLKGLESCEYLRLVTRETLRVASILPTLSRSSLVDTTLPRGGGEDGTQPIFVPKGMDTRIALFAINRRADIWGPDAEEFNPERWVGRSIGIEFSPFAAGRRKCIGREFHLGLFSCTIYANTRSYQSNMRLLKPTTCWHAFRSGTIRLRIWSHLEEYVMSSA